MYSIAMQVGIIGASGYGGVELLALCASHPNLEVKVATANTHVGELISTHTPSLSTAYPTLTYSAVDPDELDGLDLVFFALPHGESQQIVPEVISRVGAVIDLAGDFRLSDPSIYLDWYKQDHHCPELLDDFVYGLPELYRLNMRGKTNIASPGCYPTSVALALAPLLREGLLEPCNIVIDAASGVSGAGRSPSSSLHFPELDESFTAYGLLNHRHTPEMEQALGLAPGSILFTPHLAPMVRGIFATCYAKPIDHLNIDTNRLIDLLTQFYSKEPFVVVSETIPSTKSTAGSNCAHLSARFDERTGWVVVLCALDNLIKGAAGQAIQCANIIFDIPETTGLALVGMYP